MKVTTLTGILLTCFALTLGGCSNAPHTRSTLDLTYGAALGYNSYYPGDSRYNRNYDGRGSRYSHRHSPRLRDTLSGSSYWSSTQRRVIYRNYEDSSVSVCYGGYWYYQYSEVMFVAVLDSYGFMVKCNK